MIKFDGMLGNDGKLSFGSFYPHGNVGKTKSFVVSVLNKLNHAKLYNNITQAPHSSSRNVLVPQTSLFNKRIKNGLKVS